MEQPEVTIYGFLDMQVCVPEDWTDEQIVAFANSANPAGTSQGWVIRKEGNRWLDGAPERAPCAEYEGKVHVVLDC